MSKEVLFLDDSEYRCKTFRSIVPYVSIVVDAASCISKLSSQSWDVVFLDHDLGGEVYVSEEDSNTGSEVVRWVVVNKPTIGKFIVHSLNEPARANMVSKLRGAGYEADGVGFLSLIVGDRIEKIIGA